MLPHPFLSAALFITALMSITTLKRGMHCAQEREELSGLPWVRALASQPNMEQVLTAGALLSDSSARPEDHIVRLAGFTCPVLFCSVLSCPVRSCQAHARTTSVSRMITKRCSY